MSLNSHLKFVDLGVNQLTVYKSKQQIYSSKSLIMLKRFLTLIVLCVASVFLTNCDTTETTSLKPAIDVNRILAKHQDSAKSVEMPSVHQGKAFMMPSNYGEIYVRVEGEGATEFTMQGGGTDNIKRLFETIKIINKVTVINSEHEIVIIDHNNNVGYILATEGEPISQLENDFAKEIELTRFTGWGIIETNYLYNLMFKNNDKNDDSEIVDPWTPGYGGCCDGPIVEILSCRCIKSEGMAGCEGGGRDAGQCSATSADGRSCSVSKCKGHTFPCCRS